MQYYGIVLFCAHFFFIAFRAVASDSDSLNCSTLLNGPAEMRSPEERYKALREISGQNINERDPPVFTPDMHHHVNLMLGEAFLPLSIKVRNLIFSLDKAQVQVRLRRLNSRHPLTHPMPYLWEKSLKLSDFNKNHKRIKSLHTLDLHYDFILFSQLLDHLIQREDNELSKNLLYDVYSQNEVDEWRRSLQRNISSFGNRFLESMKTFHYIRSISHTKVDDFTKSWQEFVFSLPVAGPSTLHQYFFMHLFPVREQGNTLRLIRSSQIMMKLIEDQMSEEFENVFNSSSELLGHETQRGREYIKLRKRESDPNAQVSRIKGSGHSPPMLSMIEGVFSIAQAIALLTAEPIANFNIEEEVAALLSPFPGHQNSVLAEYTFLSRMDAVGPPLMRGVYFSEPMLIADEGRLRLSPAFRSHLIQNIRQRNQGVSRHPYDHTAGFPCPVTRVCDPQGKMALQYVIEAFLHVYQMVETE